MSPDPNQYLDPSQFEELNRAFYDGLSPADYFQARLMLLAHAAASGWPTTSVSTNRLQVSDFDPGSSGWQDRLVAVESFMLYHHAAETAWILFLAHEQPEGCPQLAIAGVRGGLRDRVDGYLQEADLDRRIERLWAAFALEQGILVPGADPSALRAGLEGADMLLQELGRHLLENAPVYNSAKHGMALDGTHARIGFSLTPPSENADPDAEPPGTVFSRDALWLENIQWRDEESGPRSWTRVLTAVEPDRLLALTSQTIRLIRTLWNIGRAQFGEPQERVLISLASAEDVREVAHDPAHHLQKAMIDLRYTDGRQRKITMGGVPEALVPPGLREQLHEDRRSES